MNIDVEKAVSIKRQNLSHLLKRSNVVGVGVGFKESEGQVTDEVAVMVNVTEKVPVAQLAESDKVPRDLDGVKTDVVATGRFLAGHAVVEIQNTKDRCRPTIPPGVSLGHFAVTAGTFGCLVRRGRDIFILSNNHVLANVNQAQPGDAIIQPGRYDGGLPDDKVAVLVDFIPIDFGGDSPSCSIATGIEKILNTIAQTLGSNHRLMAYSTSPGENRVDAALARPLDPGQFIPAIHKIGRPKGVREAKLGAAVQKTGRTTDYTQGQITQIDVTTSIDYNGRMATFTDQLMATGMSAGGDSGSAVLDPDGYIVGLLFAGSGAATLINPIQTVFKMLKVELVV
jgi:hypothetical protein